MNFCGKVYRAGDYRMGRTNRACPNGRSFTTLLRGLPVVKCLNDSRRVPSPLYGLTHRQPGRSDGVLNAAHSFRVIKIRS